MITRIERTLSSYITTIVLLVLYAVGMAFATFLEKYHGTAAAKAMVYYSPWFCLLQFLLAVHFIAVVVRRGLFTRKRWGMLLLHAAFIVMLIGAFISHLFGQEGVLHLREGETSNRMAVHTSKGDYFHVLPFSVELADFILTRYPGSSSPSSFESVLLVHTDGDTRRERVYMNNVLDVKGYRFFQASFDSDEQGTVLSVNRDVAGRNITYTGYLMLAAGLLLSLFGKHSRFRQLSRQLREMRGGAKAAGVLLLVAVSLFPAQAKEKKSPLLEAVQQYTVSPEHAALFGSLPVQSGNGRMMPVNTFSSEILRKLHKSDKIGRLNSDQFLISLLVLPDMWMRVPFITLPSNELADFYHLTADECAYIEVFDDNGTYKLQQRLEEAYNTMPADRSRFDKDIIKLDEKINVLHQLFNRQLLNLFPKEDDPVHTWYAAGDDLSAFAGKDSLFVVQILPWYLSEVQDALKSNDWAKADEVAGMIQTYQQAKNTTLEINPKRLATEIRYNRLDPFRLCKKGYLILGGLLLVLSFAAMFKPAKQLKYGIWALGIGVLVVFHFHMMGMGMRGYIAGYAPWSNSYETMVYVAWATVFAGLLFMRRSSVVFALATIFAGVILFVSGLNWMDPEINPLVPVLKSPWLMFHVSVIMAAYGFFGISCLIGLTNLILMICTKAHNAALFATRIKELTVVNEMSLLIGLALMTIGTFLGAVWANESWGRYWGWDPKETWALITVVSYAVTLHLRLVKKWDTPWLFNLTSVLSFATVLMTYFGVNYFLSGMHSYGQNDAVGNIAGWLYAAAAVIIALGFFSRLNRHHHLCQ
ncbi:cytochrome c-type biogenesis protein CcsB [Bacteroidales bacterium Barb6]|nr:cytochrome c-type biogenesis protein CcsB [Bacteroidales bacterium Barb6]